MDKSHDQGMSPKNNTDPGNTNGTADDGDLREMEDVSVTIDELSTALDFFEQRTDNIMEQLRELLNSNREIRQQLALEKEEVANANSQEDASGDRSME